MSYALLPVRPCTGSATAGLTGGPASCSNMMMMSPGMMGMNPGMMGNMMPMGNMMGMNPGMFAMGMGGMKRHGATWATATSSSSSSPSSSSNSSSSSSSSSSRCSRQVAVEEPATPPRVVGGYGRQGGRGLRCWRGPGPLQAVLSLCAGFCAASVQVRGLCVCHVLLVLCLHLGAGCGAHLRCRQRSTAVAGCCMCGCCMAAVAMLLAMTMLQ